MNLTEALKMIFHTNISDIKVENVISNPKLIISLLRDLTNNSDEIMAFNALINHYNFVEVFYYSENFELDYKLVYQELKVLFTKEIIEKKLNIVIKALQSTHIPKQINVTNKEVKLVNTEKEKKNIKQDEKILSEKEYFNKIIKRRTINSKLYEKYKESLNQVKILDFIKELNEELIDINKFIEYYPSNKGKLKIFIDNIYIEKHNLSKKFNSIQHSIKVTKNDNVKREVIKEKTTNVNNFKSRYASNMEDYKKTLNSTSQEQILNYLYESVELLDFFDNFGLEANLSQSVDINKQTRTIIRNINVILLNLLSLGYKIPSDLKIDEDKMENSIPHLLRSRRRENYKRYLSLKESKSLEKINSFIEELDLEKEAINLFISNLNDQSIFDIKNINNRIAGYIPRIENHKRNLLNNIR